MWSCPNCKILIEDNFNNCWKCSMPREEESTSEEIRKQYEETKKIDLGYYQQQYTVETKYPALRTISGVYNVFSWLVGIATIIVGFTFANRSQENGLLIFLAVALIGIIFVISLRAVAEVIHVFIDIEENTRKAADRNNR